MHFFISDHGMHGMQKKLPQKGRPSWANGQIFYSTVTDFAKFLGLSTSNPLFLEI